MFFYKDPAAVYHWPNFKQEVFINDKGVDFKSRLYKVKAVDLKYEEIERTHHVLKVLYNIYLYFKEKGTDTGRSTDIAYPKEIL